MNVLQTILALLEKLIPQSFPIDIPSASFDVNLGAVGNFKVSSPAFQVTVSRV